MARPAATGPPHAEPRPIDSAALPPPRERGLPQPVASRHLQARPPGKAGLLTASGIRYVPRQASKDAGRAASSRSVKAKKEKAKFSPEHLAAARELRDRYLEELTRDPLQLSSGTGKYDVARLLPALAPTPALTGPASMFFPSAA